MNDQPQGLKSFYLQLALTFIISHLCRLHLTCKLITDDQKNKKLFLQSAIILYFPPLQDKKLHESIRAKLAHFGFPTSLIASFWPQLAPFLAPDDQ